MVILKALEEAASSSTGAYIYDVFLSFRGKDTRKNFTDHLYTALLQAGYRTFRDDDEIERGESLKPELEKAIKGSRLSIIVFSKDYASSPWCLDELLMILECKRTSGHVVLPVFYDVRPSKIRKQKGRTGEAFDGYVKQYEAENNTRKKMKLMEKVKEWKEALEEVSNLAGMELKNQADGHESRFIQKIINCIRGKLRRTPLFVAPYLIGMHSRAKNINKWLQDDSSEVSLLGIWGIGGIGKTTMAKFIYNENCESFCCSCFLANVREMSETPNGLAGLQRQLLSSILNMKHEKIYNVDDGIIKIKNAVSGKTVLLVLDDVDQINQLNALCGIQEYWFHQGSKIIITTRNERLLKPRDRVFKVEELGHDESVKLFSFYAFGEDPPIEVYTEHIERVVQICRGLPLALKVLGASLSGRTVPQWTSEVKKLQAIPPSEILNKLKISYDSLEEYHDKKLFLDIACFFVGEDKNYVVKILDSIIDTHADVRIQNLIDRSLLTINYCNKLIMHELIRDMGRSIVHQELNGEPGERSLLWHQEDAYDVLRYKKGTRIIEGLALDMRMLKENDNIARKRRFGESLNKASPLISMCSFFSCFGCFSFLFGQEVSLDLRNQGLDLRTDAFEKMERLRLLKLNYTQLYGRYDNFPKSLIWLCWHGFPLKYMPIELSLEKLVALDLRHSKLEEVWAGPKFLGSLKFLNLSYSERLEKTPNFLGVPNLERLILKGCVSLIEICESIECLEELDVLDLTNCKNLRKLPRNIYKLGSLETLIVSGCLALFASGLDISATSSANGQGKWWRTLLMPRVPQPGRGPEILWTFLPRSLTRLRLSNCNLSNDSLPREFSNLLLIKDLDLSFNPFHSLPDCVTSLSSLQSLWLQACLSLDSIFGLPSNLEMLNVHFCSSLRKITFQSTMHRLIRIDTIDCQKMVEIEGIFKRESIGKVDRRIIKNLGIDFESIKNLEVQHFGLSFMKLNKAVPIQGIYENGIFSTFIPGGEIPNVFSERKKGSEMSLIVPSLLNSRIQGLNICSVYARKDFSDSYYPISIKINNKTKDRTWIYCPTVYGVPDVDEDMTWLSQWNFWNFGDYLEGGDEIDVSISVGDLFEVKECSINIVYEEDNGVVFDDNNKTCFIRKKIGRKDLSRIKLRGGLLLVCRRLYGDIYETLLANLLQDEFEYLTEYIAVLEHADELERASR